MNTEKAINLILREYMWMYINAPLIKLKIRVRIKIIKKKNYQDFVTVLSGSKNGFSTTSADNIPDSEMT